MRFSHFFIDRPIFASVLSIIILIVGAIAQRNLPIAEYPEIAPPTVNVTATYPGASAEVIAATVATPLELEINGVDDMLYINSQSTGDGRLSINVVFKPGVDIDQAQVNVQNRVAVAQPRLPQDVQRLGVVVRKASPDLMMVVHMTSPDSSRDQQYISNYATLYVKDVLSRVDGVGNVLLFGARHLPASGLERARALRRREGRDGAPEEDLPRGPRLFGGLQSDGVHPGLGRRGDRDAVRGAAAGRDRGDRVPTDLAGGDHPAARHPGVADRCHRHDGREPDLLKTADANAACACDGHP